MGEALYTHTGLAPDQPDVPGAWAGGQSHRASDCWLGLFQQLWYQWLETRRPVREA